MGNKISKYQNIEIMDKNDKPKNNISKEIIYHFRCVKCQKWWSVSSIPKNKKKWYCPWCGEGQK
ncbi:hypothetical protein KJ828_01620 [Patescibacteria group bacterium]|nr:hypothetical protein [Patescibacteria group bacterium]MBU4115932.1 hypothetical protein [Patescibacteria group bacterium]